MNSYPHHTFIVIGLILLSGMVFPPTWGQPATTDPHAQLQALEKARYLYDIEANFSEASNLLERLLSESRDEAILARANLILGHIRESTGHSQQAIDHYKASLKSTDLLPVEKERLHRRLLALDPAQLSPMALDRSAPPGAPKVFPFHAQGNGGFGLDFSRNPEMDGNRRFASQDAHGNLNPSTLPLSPKEELVDAARNALLVRIPEEQSLHFRSTEASRNWQITLSDHLEQAVIVDGDEGSVVLVYAAHLQYHSARRPVWEIPLASPGCAWHTGSIAPVTGILHCPEGGIFRVDPARRQIQPIAGIPSQVLGLTLSDGALVLRYPERIEVRRGKDFGDIAWSLTSTFLNRIYMGEDRLYLLTPQGVVKAYDARTGELEWQKDFQARLLIPYGRELLLKTFSKTLVSADSAGRVLWTYEFGWDEEMTVLPAKSHITVHFHDGKRVRLDPDLLRLAASLPDMAFRTLREHLDQKNWREGLLEVGRILNLEPGNGAAWRLRHQIQEASGISGPDAVRSLEHAARSTLTPTWTVDGLPAKLAAKLGAKWMWKRQYGPEIQPPLFSGSGGLFYLENDNRTLVFLDPAHGEMRNAFHFSEDLDMKIASFKSDTLMVSSQSRLYILKPGIHPAQTTQVSLENPVCESRGLSQGMLYSDWKGGLSLIDYSQGSILWKRKLGENGLLILPPGITTALDIVDIDGRFHSVNPNSGLVIWSVPLPEGTITETYATRTTVFTGYSQGTVAALDRLRRTVLWTRDFGEQILSLSGNGNEILMATTASKKLIVMEAATGAIMSRRTLDSHLFHKPLTAPDGYWVGTTEPALEKRSYGHILQVKYPLPHIPGSPVYSGNQVCVSTLDPFILCFPPP